MPDYVTPEMDEWTPFPDGTRLRVDETFPNIRWAGCYGRVHQYDAHSERYYLVLEDGHTIWVEARYVVEAPTADELERRIARQANATMNTASERTAARAVAQTQHVGRQYRVAFSFEGVGYDSDGSGGAMRLAGMVGTVIRVGDGERYGEARLRFPVADSTFFGWVPFASLTGVNGATVTTHRDNATVADPEHTGTVTGRFTGSVTLDTKYVQRTGDVVILGDNGQAIGCVDAQVPLGECRVKVMIDGRARWYRMVEAVSRDEEAARANATPYAPSRKLKL